MPVARCFLALFMWCLVGVGCANAPDEEPQRSTPSSADASSSAIAARPRIVALGDSLTAGLGLPESHAYPALLQNKLDAEGYEWEVVNAGVSGDTTAGARRRLDWALGGDVRILIVALGGNDGLRGLPIAETQNNLNSIVESARAQQITVLLVGMEAPPNYGEAYTKEFRQLFHDVARQHRVIFVPFLLRGVAGDARLNQADGIHPNADGARRIAETLWTALKPMVDAASSTQ